MLGISLGLLHNMLNIISSVLAPLAPVTISVDYLCVAGAGGGAGYGPGGGGGGGAGGYKTSIGGSALTLTPSTNYTVTVGAGGAGGASGNNGTIGNNSVFETITSSAGGRGGSSVGGNGGSGIVILRYPTAAGTITIGSGLTGSTATDGTNKVTTITAGSGNVSWA